MRLLILLCWLCACASSASSAARTVLVKTSDEEGAPIAGLSVEIDGVSTTRTDREGKARISLGNLGPARARIAVACPEGSREPSPRHVARTVEGGGLRLELSFVCRPRLRMLAIVVRAAGGAGSVLRADGEPLGTVADDGTLHATILREPDSELQLMLDTGALSLTPPNPLREHRLGDRDELLVFDQPLSPRARRPPPRPRPRKAGGMISDNGAFGGRR